MRQSKILKYVMQPSEELKRNKFIRIPKRIIRLSQQHRATKRSFTSQQSADFRCLAQQDSEHFKISRPKEMRESLRGIVHRQPLCPALKLSCNG